MARHLGINRATVYRFTSYGRKPGDKTLELIASLPAFPLTVEQLQADYEANYERRDALRRLA